MAQVAAEAGVTVDDVARLVAAGVVRSDDAGRFAWPDVVRVRMVHSYLAAGIGLDSIEEALRRRLLTFDIIDQYFLEPGPLSGRTYEDFAASLGDGGSRLRRLHESLGLAVPLDSRPMRKDDEEVLGEFIGAWSRVGDDKTMDRAALLLGEHLRRIVDGWVGLWVDRMARSSDVRLAGGAAGGGPDAHGALERQLELSRRLAGLLPRLLVWLEQRFLEQQLNATNAELFERGLAELGLGPPPPDHPPAIAFVDLAGFTRLTELHGDEAAVSYAAVLRDVASAAARRHRGRLVKLLGDGAMLHFRHADDALAAAFDIVDPSASADLPPAHAGIDTGRVIERDGDYFGRTVNRAARLSAFAPAGSVVVTPETVAAADGERFRFESLGRVQLRNVPEPIEPFAARPRAERRDEPRRDAEACRASGHGARRSDVAALAVTAARGPARPAPSGSRPSACRAGPRTGRPRPSTGTSSASCGTRAPPSSRGAGRAATLAAARAA
jgi:adenylate cyclase